jgi:hypothetical protein
MRVFKAVRRCGFMALRKYSARCRVRYGWSSPWLFELVRRPFFQLHYLISPLLCPRFVFTDPTPLKTSWGLSVVRLLGRGMRLQSAQEKRYKHKDDPVSLRSAARKNLIHKVVRFDEAYLTLEVSRACEVFGTACLVIHAMSGGASVPRSLSVQS